MSFWHLLLTAAALGGLGVAVWMEIKRARAEESLWSQARQRLGEMGHDAC